MRPSFSLVPWPNTGTKSAPIKLDGNQIVGFLLPASMISSAITFNMTNTLNVSSTVSWAPVAATTGTTISFVVTASTLKYYGFTQDQTAAFYGTEILQMVAASSEAANQQIYVSILARPSQ